MENLGIGTKLGVVVSPSETEGGRRPTGVSEGLGAGFSTQLSAIPNSEVIVKKPRRTFSAAQKMQILAELDACKNISERGVILRREGLYSSKISNWRKQRKKGALMALNNKRGRKALYSADTERIIELEKQNGHLQKQLKKAETIIDVQKKISEIFGMGSQDQIEEIS